jgi:hypothetical protein
MCPVCVANAAMAVAGVSASAGGVTTTGRNEEGLTHGMAWVRHHDKYGLVNLG